MNKVGRLAAALICASIASAAAASPSADICGKATLADGSASPATAAVVRSAKEWFDRINSADDAAYIRFLEERGPLLPDPPERWLDLRDFLRGFTLCGVKSADAEGVELWMFDPNFDTYAFMRLKPGATEADKPRLLFHSATDEVPPGAVRPPKLARSCAERPLHREGRSAPDHARAGDERQQGPEMIDGL